MSECTFCSIAAGDGNVREVLRTPEVVAFFPDVPATLGHTLIIPTMHVKDIWVLSRETAHVLADTTLKVAHAARSTLTIDGLNVIQSNGEMATQSVFHLHIHVVPRSDGDGIGPIWPEDKHWKPAVLDAARMEIERALMSA